MAIGPFTSYGPPGVYTQTTYEQVSGTLISSLRIPALIGPASEYKTVSNYEMVRGSSANIDILISNEDVADRWVTARVGDEVTLGQNNGTYTTFKTFNFPILAGDNTGLATTDVTKVSVVVDGEAVQVLSVEGSLGLVTIEPGVVLPESLVTVTYYFDRKDTEVTDDLSDQVDQTPCSLTADDTVPSLDLNGKSITIAMNDGAAKKFTFATSPYADIAALITALEGAFTGLDASETSGVLTFVSTSNIKIVDGGENLNFISNVDTERSKAFYVSNPYVVDGNNGGLITTNTQKVMVTVNGVSASVAELDGRTGRFVLTQAPAVGSIVTAKYYTNTWSDTFDYLPQSNVTSVSSVGASPGRSTYVDGVHYKLINDGTESKLAWGQTVVVAKDQSIGDVEWGTTQISADPVPTKIYKESLGTGNGSKIFTLDYVPVRPGTDDLSNGRVGIPTTDPSDIQVYVNNVLYTDVAYIDGKNVHLKTAPPSGQTVTATYNFSRLQKAEYSLTVYSEGVSGSGEYKIGTKSGTVFYGVTDVSGDIYDVTFPSGVEYWSDAYYINPAAGSSNVYTATVNNNGTYTVVATGVTTATFKLGQTAVLSDGFCFTIMDGTSTDQIVITTGDVVYASNSIPVYTIPGIELYVTNTFDAGEGSVASVNAYPLSNSGSPSVGSSYYVSFTYAKTSYNIGLFQDKKSIVNEFGDVSPNNPLSLAAALAIQNGATVVALKQVKKVGNSVPSGSYIAAIDSLKKPIGNNIKPHVIATLSADPAVAAYLNNHCIEMSAPRMEGERMGVVGTALGTTPAGVQSLARALNSELMVVVYPDSFIVPITNQSGSVEPKLVDGTIAAAALAGSMCSTSLDVATPLTRRTLSGFSGVGRTLDPTEANQIAVSGVSVLEAVDGGVRVRHGLTTNVATVLTRTPSVTMTVQDIQRSLRASLDPYIGQKNTPAIVKEVEKVARSMFQGKIDSEIVSKLVDLVVYIDADDPTVLRLESVYVPVFPLEYIICNLSIRIKA